MWLSIHPFTLSNVEIFRYKGLPGFRDENAKVPVFAMILAISYRSPKKVYPVTLFFVLKFTACSYMCHI